MKMIVMNIVILKIGKRYFRLVSLELCFYNLMDEDLGLKKAQIKLLQNLKIKQVGNRIPMTTDENKVLRLQVYHQLMGTQNLELNSKDNFSDLRLLLLENTPMTIFENFRFQIANKILPEFQQIGQVIHSDAKINAVIQPFDQKSSLYHLEKVKGIFANPLEWALLNHNRDQQQSLFEVNDVFQSKLLQNINIDNFIDNQFTSPLSMPLEKVEQLVENETNSKDSHRKQQQKEGPHLENSSHKFLELLAFSQFNMTLNSTNFYRKISGDFFYIHAKTLEGRDYHITASPQGFYLNSSSCTHFNPAPSTPHFVYYNLLDLFKTISQKFRQNILKLKHIKFNQIQKSMFSSFRVKPNHHNNNQWLKEPSIHVNAKASKGNHLYNFNLRNNPLGQNGLKAPWIENQKQAERDSLIIKDWNQIMQIHTINPSDTEAELINKNKFKFKLYQELANSVKDGAVKIIEGLVPKHSTALSKGTQSVVGLQSNNKNRERENGTIKYRYGSLEFWIADENIFTYRTYEKGMPSKKRINTEINSIELFEKLKLKNVHYRDMMLVKYKGYTIAAQTTLPWVKTTLRSQETEQDANQEVSKIIEGVCDSLKLSSRILYYPMQGIQISRVSIHPEFDILDANDGRRYIVNLYSLCPRDLNFAGAENNASFLRRELIQLYQSQVSMKYGDILLNTMVESSYKIIENEKVRTERMKLIEMSKFARQSMVPSCLKSFESYNKKYLGDSKTVVKIMHSFGLSSRYLGMLWNLSLKSPNISHISTILERVILVKSLKNIIKKAMRDCISGELKALLTWLFNCVFHPNQISETNSSDKFHNSNHDKDDQEKDQSQTTHSKKRRRKNENEKYLEKQFQENCIKFKINNKQYQSPDSIGFIKPDQFWKIVKKISHFKFGADFQHNRISELGCMKSRFGKSAVLRDLCISLGVVIERTQYFKKEGQLFKPQNICDVVPIIKHARIENDYFSKMIRDAQNLLKDKKIEEAIDNYIKAIHFAMVNLGVMTQKFVLAHKKISDIYFRIGEIEAALLFAHHAEKLLEHLYGYDHVETLEIYKMLSQIYFIKKKFNVSEHYLLKMLSLAIVSYGEQYPEILPGYLNLSTIYLNYEKYIDSISCCVKALNSSLKLFGENHLNTAICYAAIAEVHYQIPDIQKSIIFQEKSIKVLERILRETDCRIKQAETTLEFYKSLQNSKKVKECHEKQRKRLSNNLYANFPLFKMPQITWKQRQHIVRRMQTVFSNPNSRPLN